MISNKPVITFDSYRIEKLTVMDLTSEDNLDQKKPHMNLVARFGLTEDRKYGRVKQVADCISLETGHQIHIELVGKFTVKNLEADVETIQSYISGNANAMLYPYWRSIVSIVSTIDSSQATILPTLSFWTSAEKLNADKERDDTDEPNLN